MEMYTYNIVNYDIDDISSPDSPSWILRLNRPLPNNVVKLNKCFVAREVLNTQIQNINYQELTLIIKQ